MTSLPCGGVAGVVSERLYWYFTSIISIVAMHRWMRVMAADGMEREERSLKVQWHLAPSLLRTTAVAGAADELFSWHTLRYLTLLSFTLSNSNVESFVLPNVFSMYDIPTLASSQSR